jgi:hypothetical protein
LEDKKQVNRIFSNIIPVVVSSCAFLMVTSIASASILGDGNLSVANCAGGGATVTATTVVWSPAGTAANTGCIDSGIATSISYTGGTLGAGVVGNIMDLSAGVLPVNDFMTFSGTPLDFELTGVGPGLTNTNCNLNATTNTTCSPFAGSPFVLTYISANVTGVALGVNGIVSDGTGGTTATWAGSFTTQLNLSGATIQSDEAGGGSISSAQSGNFNVVVSTAPEPSTMVMMLLGSGLIALTTVRRNRRRS